MAKQKIGTWLSYTVYLHKSDKETYWTVESGGKEHNRFDDAESFGHWLYHSGFRPDGAVKAEKKETKKSEETMPIRMLIGAGSLSIEQLRKFGVVVKAHPGLVAKKVTVKGPTKTYTQTKWVRTGEQVKPEQMELKTLSEEDIAKFKKNPSQLYFKMVQPMVSHWYKKTNLRSVGISYDDAKQEGDLSAYKALMSYKKGGQAKLSTLVYTSVRNKFYNVYKTAKNRLERVQTDRFGNIDDMTAHMDTQNRGEVKVIIGNVKDKIKDKENINNTEYLGLFQEWLDGYSMREMGSKRNISREMVASKFKRIIYPILVDVGVEKGELSRAVAEKQKFLKKSKMSPAFALLYKGMSDMLGVKTDAKIDHSEVMGRQAALKLEELKKLSERMKGRREEKLYYRIIKNFDLFSLPFIRHMMKYKIKDVDGKTKKGYSVSDKTITVYDSDSLAVMQYNVIMALIAEYIKDKGIYVNVSDSDREDASSAFNKEFGYDLPQLRDYVAFHVLLYMFDKLAYKDNDINRYKKVAKEPDKNLEYIYERIF